MTIQCLARAQGGAQVRVWMRAASVAQSMEKTFTTNFVKAGGRGVAPTTPNKGRGHAGLDYFVPYLV